jgi:hypothetical protein
VALITRRDVNEIGFKKGDRTTLTVKPIDVEAKLFGFTEDEMLCTYRTNNSECEGIGE